MTEIQPLVIKISNLPEALDDALIQKRDGLIRKGKNEFKAILIDHDLFKPEEEKRVKAVIAAKKGAYSRKFFQYAKELFILELFERNGIPLTFKNFNFMSQKIFEESLDHSAVARLEKHVKYGKGVQSPIVIENEARTIAKIKMATQLMIVPYRKEVLFYLAFDTIYEDYSPKVVKRKNKKLKI